LLAQVWRFAADMTGIAVVSLVLTQLDRLILSRLLPLREFGYYSLATVVASGLLVMATPFFTATFPPLTQLAEASDEPALARLYRRSSQTLAVLVLPAATMLALFAREALAVWTNNPELVERAHLLVSLLAVGTALNSLMHIPYALQLAHGWAKLALYQNIISVVLLAPLIILFANWYGGAGAACVWIALNVGYVIFDIQVMHTRLLAGEKLRWYRDALALPLGASLVVALLGRVAMPGGLERYPTLAYLLAVGALTLAAAAWATPAPQQWLRQRLALLQVRLQQRARS
jgi:O-antigen/teichoic acid export membrane protein